MENELEWHIIQKNTIEYSTSLAPRLTQAFLTLYSVAIAFFTTLLMYNPSLDVLIVVALGRRSSFSSRHGFSTNGIRSNVL